FADLEGVVSPPEIGETLLDNARVKARAALEASGLAAIADDTGLEIDALNGRPGVRSARYAGPRPSDEKNVAEVLQQMSAVPPEARRARFHTVMVACFPDGREVVGEGVLEGEITFSPRGREGFGYDPIFQLSDGRTLAELSLGEKTQISHRTQALEALLRGLGMVPK
ncbi:MAG: RdgB/HAM1 family non-canonical purine NTP pyrophosphatase, partial [Candidatus Eiseniibacteriota bacterium]